MARRHPSRAYIARMAASPQPSSATRAAARALLVDGWTAEAAAAFERAGIPCILLKGAALASWLYPGDVRAYGDADLLVPPDRHAAAEALLGSLGYEPARNLGEPEVLPADWGRHSRPWMRRADGATVDLHQTLWALPSSPATVWKALGAEAVPQPVGGRAVLAPAVGHRAFIVAIHALQHEGQHERPLEDLRRAVAAGDLGTWRQAVQLAHSLGATASLVRGLALLPEGEELARRLGLPSAAEVALEGGSQAVGFGFARLAATEGLGARLRFVAREVVPEPEFLRWWAPWAARGRGWLALAYAYRVGWLVTHAPAGFAAWRRARRRGR